MKVKVVNRVYRMSKTEYRKLLEVASDQVPQGIYAIEKKDYAELRCDRRISVTQIKRFRRQFKAEGYKVYVNGV